MKKRQLGRSGLEPSPADPHSIESTSSKIEEAGDRYNAFHQSLTGR